jgi:xanthine dehydrogenase YagR molybdenum-binding subunit
MSVGTSPVAVGAPVDRIEGRLKVTGQARYAYETPVEGVAYAAVVQATIAKGTIRDVHAEQALAQPGVLAVLWEGNAPRVANRDEWDLAVLQTREVAYRGQIVAAVVAETFEAASDAAALVHVDYDAAAHDVVLRADHPGLYKPDKVNPAYETDTVQGDPDAALASAAVVHDATYATPAYHNNPMEPHAALAIWDGGISRSTTPTRGRRWPISSSRRSSGWRPSGCASSPSTSAAASAPRACRAPPPCSRRSPRRPWSAR